tara:strand:- start:1206 stop:1355 length:150 start_codon:yes stop_codon:yes gene_type:complete
MDKYQSEAEAIKKRVDEAVEYKKWREKKVKEGYQLYLAYMENRALNNKQ